MKDNNRNDLTQGSITRKLLWVAVPIMGTQLVQMTYNLADMFWLGQGVGSDAVAASGTAGLFLWLSMAFLLIGRMGAEIGVSQNLGKGDAEAARSFSQNALFIGIILGVSYGLFLLIFHHPLIAFFQIQDPVVVKDTESYLMITSVGIPVMYISAAIMGTFNGAGNSRLSFICNAVGLAINMVLDPLFIIVWRKGVVGAAIATVLAQVVVCVLFLVAVKSNKGRPFVQYNYFVKPDKQKISQILKWSVPIGLESMFFTLLTMFVSRFVAGFGVDAMAVSRIGSQIESLSWLVGGGFGSAVTAFVGQNYGAGKWERIEKGFKISTALMVVYGVFITVTLACFGKYLYLIFIQDQGIVTKGATYLQILAICQIVACLESVGAGCFRGIGKTVPPSAASIVSNIIRVPLCYYLGQTALGLNGIFWGITISAFLRSSTIFIWYMIHRKKLPKTDKRIAV